MALKPWREIAIPHDDVLNGTSQQSDFAADLSTVARGEAKTEYQDAATFYSRTYITEGMSQLLKNVIMRLNGKGGEPVIQLQTSFGGGKTHSMIAVYHLAKRKCALADLQGVPSLLDSLQFIDIPEARVVVLDGNSLSPGQAWSHGNCKIHTMWGELAWQIGGEEAYKILEESDKNGTSPGKDILVSLFSKYSPCVILIDELLAFMRQLFRKNDLSAGGFNENISFLQALTESVKILPNCILLASLPESASEIGDENAHQALLSLEKIFGRIQAIWKPVDIEESFEIVRRRLFKTVADETAKKEVCRSFFDMYISEGNKIPREAQESAYLERLEKAYPIHPELFDCLYEEWATLEKFQKTRGTLKLLSTVIFTLWKQGNTDLIILPSSMPIADGKVSTELCAVLNGSGWEQVISKDIDSEGAESVKIDMEDTRLGALQSARRTARTIFMKTAPIANTVLSAATSKQVAKGVAIDYILLSCLQPKQNSSLYIDAVNKISDKLHYLNVSGNAEGIQKRYYSFATTANMRKEMEDRCARIKPDSPEVINLIRDELKKLTCNSNLFGAIHVFTKNDEVPDDNALRLVVLSTNQYFSTTEGIHYAQDAVRNYVTQFGNRLRAYQNRLVFLAADGRLVAQVIETSKKYIAWASIIQDANNGQLNLDIYNLNDAKQNYSAIAQALNRQIQSCWKHLLVPTQSIYDSVFEIENISVNNNNRNYITSVEDSCTSDEFVIKAWGAIHLYNLLKDIYWKNSKEPKTIISIWEDMAKYLYMPRLQNRNTFEKTVEQAAKSIDYFAVADGIAEDGRLLGLKLGEGLNVFANETFLVPVDTAKAQIDKEKNNKASIASENPPADKNDNTSSSSAMSESHAVSDVVRSETSAQTKRLSHFYLEQPIASGMLPVHANKIYEEIVSILTKSPNTDVKVNIILEAEFPDGIDDNTVRAVSENLKTLNMNTGEWS